MAGLLCVEKCGRPRKNGRFCWHCYKRSARETPAQREKRREQGRAADKARQCQKQEYMRDWVSRNPDRMAAYAQRRLAKMTPEKKKAAAEYKRERHSGWTAEHFEAAWQLQSGRCALCGVVMRREGRSSTSVAADHHEPDGVKTPRALLCVLCNRTLGFYEKTQRPNGLRLDAYERYLAAHALARPWPPV